MRLSSNSDGGMSEGIRLQHWFTLGAHNTNRHCLTHNKCTLGSYLGHLVKTSQMPSHCITHHDTPGFVAINGDNEIHVQLPNRENHLVAGWTSENLAAIHRHTISFLVWSSLSKRWESFDRLFILEMKPHQCFGGAGTEHLDSEEGRLRRWGCHVLYNFISRSLVCWFPCPV